MESLWLILGIVVLASTLIDVFLTALNFDESGFLGDRVAAGQWHLLRRVTRRLPRRWRPVALRQVTGLQVVATIAVWVCGTILGYGLIYYAKMSPQSFTPTSGDRQLNFFDALYFSAAQLATVGGSDLTAETDPLRFLSILESLTGVVLISLILTYLLGVYDVIGSLNLLCRQFSTTERGAGSAVTTLAPYFQGGQAQGLDGRLSSIQDALTAYMDGLRMHHTAYYFQSGRDQFALPYALRMVGDTLAALRWGLPAGHPASSEPALPPLVFQYVEFADQLQDRVQWRDVEVPEVVAQEAFKAHAGRGPMQGPRDRWVMRFLGLDARMAELAAVEPLTDLDDAYRRYTEWLPFAHRAEITTQAVSDNLDYQPLIVTDTPVTVLREHNPVVLESVQPVPEALPPSARRDQTVPGRTRLGPRLLRARASLVDPGNVRLRAATRALIAASASVVTSHLLLQALGQDRAMPAAIFSGFVAMISTGVATAPGLHDRRLASLLVVFPVWIVLLLGALTSDVNWLRGAVLVLVAFIGVGAARLGALWGSLGGAAFMAFYFALILRLDLEDLPWFAAAALVGAVWAYVSAHLLLPDRRAQMLRHGVRSLTEQMTASVDTLVDAVSWARWDPEVRHQVTQDMKRMHNGAAFVAAQLSAASDEAKVAPPDAEGLRLRVFDAELAMMTLKSAARGATGTTLTLETRARLAGRLELLRADLTARRSPDSTSAVGDLLAAPPEPPPQGWPPEARRLLRAIDGFHRAVVSLSNWGTDPTVIEPLDPHDPHADATLASIAPQAPTPDRASRFGPSVRRAVQAGVATAVSLVIGAVVSGAHQYWATLAAYQTLGNTDGETLSRGVRRVVGTVAGAAAGFAVALASNGSDAVMVPVLALALFASVYYRPVASGTSTFWTTLIFAGVYEYLGALTSVTLEQRIIETFLGSLTALAVAWWVLPTRTRRKINEDIAVLTKDLEVVAAGGLERLAGSEEISRSAIQQRLLAMDRKVRSLRDDAAPSRYTLGSYEAGGIEAQLTAVWSMTATTRQLVHAVESAKAEGDDTSGPDWTGVRLQLEQNAAALLTALSDRVPNQVSGNLTPGIDEDRLTPLDGEIFGIADRLNRTMLALVDLLSPESPGEEA